MFVFSLIVSRKRFCNLTARHGHLKRKYSKELSLFSLNIFKTEYTQTLSISPRKPLKYRSKGIFSDNISWTYRHFVMDILTSCHGHGKMSVTGHLKGEDRGRTAVRAGRICCRERQSVVYYRKDKGL